MVPSKEVNKMSVYNGPIIGNQEVLQELIAEVRQQMLNFPCMDILEILPYVHKGKFVRIPAYYDGYMGFGSSTALVGEETIRVCNCYKDRKNFPFSEIQAAATFLQEV